MLDPGLRWWWPKNRMPKSEYISMETRHTIKYKRLCGAGGGGAICLSKLDITELMN